MTHEDGRKLSRSAQDAARRKAVEAVVKDGMPQIVAARVFGVSKTTVCLWVKAYRQGGWAALESKPKGRPKGGKLTKAQEMSIRKSVLGKNPSQLRLPGLLWTRDLIGELIQRRFDVKLSRWTVGRHLKGWGLTPHKPARRSLEQNPAQVKYWLETKYPAIERQAKEEGARIWWGDETELRSDHQSGTTWSEIGQTPLVKVSGNRFSCKMISAVTNRGDMTFMVFEGRFSTKTFLGFLKRLVKQQAGRKVFIIVSRHPVHKARAVEEWIAAQDGKIRLFFLPAYRPELSPDELVNQDVKSNAFRQKKAKEKSVLTQDP